MKNILVIYHYIAHYRLPIFNELSSSEDTKFFFAAGNETDTKIKIASEEDIKKNRIKLVLISNIWFFKKRLLWQKGLIKLVFVKKYDSYIFLGNPYFVSTWVSILLCNLLNKRVLIWTHGVTKPLGKTKTLIFKLLWFLADDILLYGNYAKKEMIKIGVDKSKLHVIYNSLDYKKQLSVRKTLIKTNIYKSHFKNMYPVVIFLGRLNKVKKLDMIIEAQSILNKKSVFFNTILVGDGPEMEFLKASSKKANLEKFCWFYGACYEENKIGELIKNADICLAPGNVGLTAMHSMVYGTPVITHSDFSFQMPEYEAVIDEETGAFFQRDNINDLVDVLELWLNKSDNEKSIIEDNCMKVIDENYNPMNQKSIINKVLEK